MYIYDSLKQQKISLDNEKITIYNCGPTVYNHVHIGNIRPLITFDILYKYLKFVNKNPYYVHNITDIDDKIIKKAKENNVSEQEISEKYYEAYLQIIDKLNVSKMDLLPKVTKNIDGIIEYVEKLVDKKCAYVGKNGDVFFSIDSVKDTYGTLSKQKIEQLISDSRKEIDVEYKQNPLDFVLWKNTTEGVNWKTKWNEHGRPGWHTECAYFINHYIGDQVTIHGGGIDLKFPHHENENAQNIALTGKGLSKIWMHVGHININNAKMSKSLNNFIYAKDIIEKYDSATIRMFFLQTKYQNPINYSDSLLNEAKSLVEKIFKNLNSCFFYLISNNIEYKKDNCVNDKFIEYMDDDLDFPNVVTLIIDQQKKASAFIRNNECINLLRTINEIINELSILGILYNNKIVKDDVLKWKSFYEAKDYKNADLLREKIINII